MIGVRLRRLRELRGFSQGDLEHRTGLRRTYLSRVENGHMTPSLGVLERLAAGLNMSLYQLFYNSEPKGHSAPVPVSKARQALEALAKEYNLGKSEAWFLFRLRKLANRITDADRELILAVAQRLTLPRESRYAALDLSALSAPLDPGRAAADRRLDGRLN